MEKILIKQIMPIPQNLKISFRNEIKFTSLCFALYDKLDEKNNVMYSNIGVYAIDKKGFGELEEDFLCEEI
ncbi:MAG: hypothetical protein M0R40_00590 [Firmicutes bacterium]|nr:hypothetical protein [Bacillota bacterium]